MKTVTCIAVVFLCAFTSLAQKRFQLNVGFNPAIGNFSKGYWDDYSPVYYGGSISFAGVGTNLGLEYHHPIGSKGFHVFGSLDGYWNPTKRSVKKGYEADFGGSYDVIKHRNFLNVALSAGVHYEHAVSETVSLFAQTGVLGDLLIIPKTSLVRYNLPWWTETTANEYSSSMAPGFSLTLGTVIKQRFVIGIGYRNLGAHTLERTYTKTYEADGISNPSTDHQTLQKKMSIATLTFGLRF